jgi:hypothetical protein
VTIVGKERGTGTLYTASKEIDVSIGGCGGWFNQPNRNCKIRNK